MRDIHKDSEGRALPALVLNAKLHVVFSADDDFHFVNQEGEECISCAYDHILGTLTDWGKVSWKKLGTSIPAGETVYVIELDIRERIPRLEQPREVFENILSSMVIDGANNILIAYVESFEIFVSKIPDKMFKRHDNHRMLYQSLRKQIDEIKVRIHNAKGNDNITGMKQELHKTEERLFDIRNKVLVDMREIVDFTIKHGKKERSIYDKTINHKGICEWGDKFDGSEPEYAEIVETYRNGQWRQLPEFDPYELYGIEHGYHYDFHVRD